MYNKILPLIYIGSTSELINKHECKQGTVGTNFIHDFHPKGSPGWHGACLARR